MEQKLIAFSAWSQTQIAPNEDQRVPEAAWWRWRNNGDTWTTGV